MNRRKLLTAAAAAAPLLSAADQPLPKLPNITLDPAKAKKLPDPNGEHLSYFEGPTDQLKLMVAGSFSIHPGKTPHPPHKHEEEEFMLVTSGSGWIEIEGKRQNVAAGAMMYCAANKNHQIMNTGKTPMMFYYYKWKV